MHAPTHVEFIESDNIDELTTRIFTIFATDVLSFVRSRASITTPSLFLEGIVV